MWLLLQLIYDTYTFTNLLISFDISLTDVNLILTKMDCAYCALFNIAYPYLLAYSSTSDW